MNAWLITWEWTGTHAAVVDRVAAILGSRKSESSIEQIIQFMYIQATAFANEFAAYANRPRRIPYQPVKDAGMIFCGHNPYLLGRRVQDLSVNMNEESGIETICWVEPAYYRWDHERGQRTLHRQPVAKSTQRCITGPLSNELIYDRLTGAIKPGFEDCEH